MARPVDPSHVREERPVGRDERSLGDLFSELTRETTELVRQEMALAKAEMSQKATSVARDVAYLAAGGLVLYAGFLALLAALIIGISQAGLTWWISALIVGAVVVAIGGFLVMAGIKNLKNQSLAPQKTVDSLKEDAKWAKEQTS